MSLYCPDLYDSFNVTTRNKVANCCLQKIRYDVDWNNINDLDEFYKNSKNFRRIRKNFQNGIKDPTCDHCWKLEKNNQESKRLRVSELRQKKKINKPSIKHLDLRPSNKCNLQCRMCQPSCSDQLEKVALNLKKQGIDTDLLRYMPHNASSVDINKIFQLIPSLPSLESIRFAGGEPFVMPEVEELIFKLIEAKKTDISIEFITNCTSAKTDVIEALKSFKKVTMSCSIDGVGKQLEYQRYPSKWTNIEKNFVKLYENNFHINLIPCISILNLTEIHHFFEWSKQFDNLRILYNEVDFPDFLNFRFVPLELRSDLIEYLKSNDLVNVDRGWKIFKESTVFEHKKMSDEQKKLLNHYVFDIWDRTSTKKFLEVYPWGNVLLK